jgi:cytochrome c-type biogenesis protein
VSVLAAGIGQSFQTAVAAGPLLLGLGAAALAGLVSFASPCCIPLVPGYLSYLAGASGADGRAIAGGDVGVKATGRWRVTGAAALFVAGFTAVLLAATVSVFGVIGVLAVTRELLQRFVGLIPALQRDIRPRPRRLSTLAGAPLLGATFGLGWTPCLGPTLAGVLSVAAGTQGVTAARGVALIIAYCAGLGLPFIALAFGSTSALLGVGWLCRHRRAIQLAGGIMLIAVGAALVTGVWALFVGWLRDEFVTNDLLPI